MKTNNLKPMLKATFAVGCTVVAAALAGYLVGLSSGYREGYLKGIEVTQNQIKASCVAWYTGDKASVKPTRDIMACKRMAWVQ